MKKIISILFLLLALPVMAQNAIVTATITAPSGAAYANGSFSITLVDANGNDLSTTPVNVGGNYITIAPKAGALDGFGSFTAPVPLLENSAIISPTGTKYRFGISSAQCTTGPRSSFSGSFAITSSPVDLSSSLSALAPEPQTCGSSGTVRPAPQFSVYGQQGTGTQAVATAIPGVTADTSGNLTTPSVNKIVNAAAEAGATADVKLNACLAAIPSGGTCDARGFGNSTQTMAATVTIGSGQSVIFSPSTTFIPASASVQPIALADGGQLLGDFVWNVTSLLTWNSSALTNSGKIQSPKTHIDRVHCYGIDGSGNTDTLGSCVSFDGAGSSAWVQFVTADGIEVQGLHSGVKMITTDGGWVNGNTLSNVNCADTLYCIDIEPNGTIANGTQVSNNSFPNWSAEYLMPGAGTPQSGQIPIYVVPATGTGQSSRAVNNVFAWGNAYDFPNGSGSANYIAEFGAVTYRNIVKGALGVNSLLQVSNSGVSNYVYDTDIGGGTDAGWVNTWIPIYDSNGVRQGYIEPSGGSTLPGNVTITGNSLPSASVPKTSPVADIRANGALIDGATDISTALNASIAQCNASNGNSCTVLLPCGGAGCYLANGSSVTWSNPSGYILHVKQQGTLYLGSTLVPPSNISWTCDGGGQVGDFQFAGPNCKIMGKSQVTGTLGTAITTTGSPVTFTPTYNTGASASNFNANSAITVAGLQTCSATATRTANATKSPNTTFTLTSCTDSSGDAEASPATPVGSLINVTGCSDSTFNITGAPVNAQDWPNNTESIYENAATSTATGCTVTGFDNNTFETVPIASCTSGTCTATFLHKHAAADVYGMVTVAPLKRAEHIDFQSSAIASMGGVAMWLYETNNINLSQDNFSSAGNPVTNMTGFGLECAGCWQGSWDKDSFIGGVTPANCTSSCNATYPWSVRFTQIGASATIGVGGAFIPITAFTIDGGIKVDAGGVAATNGVGPELGPITGGVFEETNNGAVTVDPSISLGSYVSVSMNYDFLQDNILGNPQYYLAGTSCCVTGFANLGDLPSFDSFTDALANKYWANHVQANNVLFNTNPASVGNSTGLLTSGDTILGNFAGENAGLAPNIVPVATLSVTLNPTCATCSTVTGPDGIANSATEVQTTSGGATVFEQVGSASVSTYAGDEVVFGAYCKPGTGETTWKNRLLTVSTQGTDRFLANTFYPATGVSTAISANGPIPMANGTWEKCFAVGQLATGESTAHNLLFDLISPNGGTSVGNDFFDPFWFVVPGPNNPSYAGIPQAEVVRWAEEMFKGYVPSGASTGNLYYNPAYAISSGPNTIIPANATLPYVGTKTYSGTGTPSDTCSATVNTGAIEVNATPTAYQCSNATGSYAWNALGGGGSGNMSDGAGTATSGEFPETTATAHDYSLNTPAQVLTQIGAAPALTNCTDESATFTPASGNCYFVTATVSTATPAANSFVLFAITTSSAGSMALTGTTIADGGNCASYISGTTLTLPASKSMTVLSDGTNLRARCSAPAATIAVATIPATTYSGTAGISPTTFYTTPNDGTTHQYMGCMTGTVTVAGTAGTADLSINSTYSAHGFVALQTANLTLSTQWSAANLCGTFLVDPNTAVQYRVYMSGATGTPTVGYGFTLTELQ